MPLIEEHVLMVWLNQDQNNLKYVGSHVAGDKGCRGTIDKIMSCFRIEPWRGDYYTWARDCWFDNTAVIVKLIMPPGEGREVFGYSNEEFKVDKFELHKLDFYATEDLDWNVRSSIIDLEPATA